MPWLLKCARSSAGVMFAVVTAAGVSAAMAGSASAGYGGGYGGTSGSGIWALAWWAGNPEGPGPYIGPSSDAAGQCVWHDTGHTVSDLGTALSQSSLPNSFWTRQQSGGHPGIWGVLEWANELARTARADDHFDLVACPSATQVPPGGGDVESALPRAHPPGGKAVFVWAYFDTVGDPPTGALPPVITEAFDELSLPGPSISTSPDDVHGIAHSTVVNLATWLWIAPGIWHTFTASATSGAITATVWATPASVTWTAGWDFSAASQDPEAGTNLAPEHLDVSCGGPGRAYGASPAPGGGPQPCTAVFSQSSLGTWQQLRATVDWTVHWAVSGATGIVGGEGVLPPAASSASSPIRVMQVESIISSG